jgi:hypothetical protein
MLQRSAEGVRRYWDAERPVREAEREAVRTAAAAQIGQLSDREILIAGAIAYWCEGAKNKPERRYDRVVFTNSDPALSRAFLHFLDAAGVGRERVIYRVQIHESADVHAAQQFWLRVTQADPSQFRQPTLKRHNPKTARTNTGDDYRGCLRIEVSRGTELYRKIEGWATAIMAACDRPREPSELPPEQPSKQCRGDT